MKLQSILRLLPMIGLLAGPSSDSASAETPLRAHPENPYILEFRGQPTVLRTFGEHYGSVINSDFDFVPYLDVLQRDGMNLTRAFLVGFRTVEIAPAPDPLAPTPAGFVQPWPRTGTHGNALDGLGKWDFSAWNEAYFVRLDTFAQAASDRGIAIELTLFCTQYTEIQWRASPFNPANNVQGFGPASRYDSMRPVDANLLAVQEAVVRRIVREVNRFDNIYFEIENEPFWDEPGVKDAQEVDFHHRMLAHIRSEESGLPNRHLVAHNYPQQLASLSSDFDVINEHYPAVVPDTFIAGAEALLRDHYGRGRILSLDETDTINTTQIRLESWMFLLGGGGIYNGLDVHYDVYSNQDESGDNTFGRAARGAVRNIGTYISSLDLVALRRNLSWIAGGLPAGATLQAMSEPGQQYVAYLHHGQRGVTTFQLSYNPIDGSAHTASPVVTLPQGTWRAVWTRPVDLVELRSEVFTHAGGARTLAPVTYYEDAALRIDRVVAGPNTAPLAVADGFASNWNTALVVPAPGVLANDTDAQADPLTAVIDVVPSHGILILNANGGFTYTPAAGYAGVDSFTYHANDGSLDSNITTATFTINAITPVALVNGSFESGYTGWTATGNQTISSALPYVATDGTMLVSFNRGNLTPNATISQSFATVAGQTYTLAFDAGVHSYNTNTQTIVVTVNGASILLTRSIMIIGQSGGTNHWLPQSFTFVADSATTTLAFRDQSSSTIALDLLLDNVRITTTTPGTGGGTPTGIGTLSFSGTPGDVTISMTATGSGVYFLECSEDLVVWERIGSVELTAPGQISFLDTRGSGGTVPLPTRMFYRVGTESDAGEN